MRPLRHPMLWLMPGLIWAAWLTYASLAPVPQGVELPSDKLLHFLAYFILLYLLGCWAARHYLPWTIVAGVCLGLGLEYLQGMLPYRDFEWGDGLANLTGAAAGALLAMTPAGQIYVWLENRRYERR